MPRFPSRPAAWFKRSVRRAARWSFLWWFPSRTTAFRPSAGSDAVVVMNLWNRPTRLAAILAMLDGQQTRRGIRLLLWNNARRDHEVYERAIAEFQPSGALTSISLVRSPLNLGSMSRFYWVRRVAKLEGSRPVIVLDDDENVQPDFVERALEAYDPSAFTAFWAFRVGEKYWEREFAGTGEQVNHIGPGGMVCDAAFFLGRGFFTEMPEQYWFLDDVWLSAYGPSRGRRLAKLDVEIEFVMDETNSYRSFIQAKEDFYRLLAPLREQTTEAGRTTAS